MLARSLVKKVFIRCEICHFFVQTTGITEKISTLLSELNSSQPSGFGSGFNTSLLPELGTEFNSFISELGSRSNPTSPRKGLLGREKREDKSYKKEKEKHSQNATK